MAPPPETLTRSDGKSGDPTALGRWRAYRQRLEALGADVRVLPSGAADPSSRASFYREVFTRDRAFLIGDMAFLPDLSPGVMREYDLSDAGIESHRDFDRAFRRQLQRDGVRTVTTEGHFLEGGNLVYDRQSNTLFIGMADTFVVGGNDPDRRAAYEVHNSHLADIFRRRGINVEFVPLSRDQSVQERYYHLDTAMAVLPHGELMVYPGAITEAARQRLQRLFEGRTIIMLTEEEGANFPTNLASVGNTLIPTQVFPGLQARLQRLGYRVMGSGELGRG
jgi:N-dimethylarginine dimethylaminohydrolase